MIERSHIRIFEKVKVVGPGHQVSVMGHEGLGGTGNQDIAQVLEETVDAEDFFINGFQNVNHLTRSLAVLG